jgi:predicted oxidoreductase
MSEDHEQEVVCRWLEARAIPYFHVPNEGNRSISYAMRMKRLGLKAGIPDLIIVKPHPDGRHIAIEMKAPGGRLSESQKTWHSIMGKNNWLRGG